jgi:hypothetical protein
MSRNLQVVASARMSGGGGMLPVALNPNGSRIALGWEHHIGL